MLVGVGGGGGGGSLISGRYRELLLAKRVGQATQKAQIKGKINPEKKDRSIERKEEKPKKTFSPKE